MKSNLFSLLMTSGYLGHCRFLKTVQVYSLMNQVPGAKAAGLRCWSELNFLVTYKFLEVEMHRKVCKVCMLSSSAPEHPLHITTSVQHPYLQFKAILSWTKDLNSHTACLLPSLWFTSSQCVHYLCIVCLCVWSMIILAHWEPLLNERVPQTSRMPPRSSPAALCPCMDTVPRLSQCLPLSEF